MESLETIRTFLGWTIVVHVVVMLLIFSALMLGGSAVRSIHGRMMGLSDEDLSRAYFQFLAQYKIGVWLFAIGPWVALHLMN